MLKEKTANVNSLKKPKEMNTYLLQGNGLTEGKRTFVSRKRNWMNKLKHLAESKGCLLLIMSLLKLVFVWWVWFGSVLPCF